MFLPLLAVLHCSKCMKYTYNSHPTCIAQTAGTQGAHLCHQSAEATGFLARSGLSIWVENAGCQ